MSKVSAQNGETMLKGLLKVGYVVGATTAVALLGKRVTNGGTTDFDRRMTLKLQTIDNPTFDRTMHVVSWPGFPPQSRVIPWEPPAAMLSVGSSLEALFQLLAWGTDDFGLVKRVVQRPRPSDPDIRVTEANIGGSSFPSGHVTIYTGVYGLFAYPAHCYVPFTWLRRLIVGGLTAMIALVGPSRVYLGHHWFSDVVASYLLGTSYAGGPDLHLSAGEKRISARLTNRPEIVGHGGAAGFYTSNSAASIQKAVKLDVDRVEVDVQRSADDQLFLFHDNEIQIAGKTVPVRLLTLADMQSLYPEVITSAEGYEIVAGKTPLMLDIKTRGSEELLAEAIRSMRTDDDVSASSTHGRTLRILRAQFPKMKLALSRGHSLTKLPSPDLQQRLGGQTICVRAASLAAADPARDRRRSGLASPSSLPTESGAELAGQRHLRERLDRRSPKRDRTDASGRGRRDHLEPTRCGAGGSWFSTTCPRKTGTQASAARAQRVKLRLSIRAEFLVLICVVTDVRKKGQETGPNSRGDVSDVRAAKQRLPATWLAD